ncbi:uncharacterized protein LOC116613843 [Nematostella vectensis]|uniref:uncharacterized protein LOC116613843 n=1 Tax=Nematostella vectensis TaxID=45351 RepID=UPI002076F2FB|nr:uncharacterized protein LOC116613843 [Nematostella vectensis]
MSFQALPEDIQIGRHTFGTFTSGTLCEEVSFPKNFPGRPDVYATQVHTVTRFKKDAATIWVEDIKPPSFHACLRELKNFNGAHEAIVVRMTDTGFELCMKDGQKHHKKHTMIDIQYMALGDLDPCLYVTCGFYAQCVAFGPGDAWCVCDYTCPSYHDTLCSTAGVTTRVPLTRTRYVARRHGGCDYTCPSYQDTLCSTAGVTYKNTCQYQKAICQAKENTPISHAGNCRPFILQRGRAQLSLDSVDVQCQELSTDSTQFYSSLEVHALLTVNYDGQATNATHDAITTWVEKISHSKFTTCALKVGRNEYEGLETFLVKILYFKLLQNKFGSQPSILLTAKHTRADLKHDSATLWTEDISAGNFKLCLRELQNFDGAHKDIRVNWLAYEDLPRNFFSEHNNVEFAVNYRNVPTMLISATHNSTRSGAILPKYNSIASWVENVDKRGFRVCVREFNDEGTYDPVAVSWTTLPGNHYTSTGNFNTSTR